MTNDPSQLLVAGLVIFGWSHIAFVLWMFGDAIWRGKYFWAFFVLILWGLSALIYFFRVYRHVSDDGIVRRCLGVYVMVVILWSFSLAGLTVWICQDGLFDEGAGADMALVVWGATQRDDVQDQNVRQCLDTTAKLYMERRLSLVMVSGTIRSDGYDESMNMARYLRGRGLPSFAIILDSNAVSDQAVAEAAAKNMRDRNFRSVMIVSDFYRIARLKLALGHEDILTINHAHIAGKLPTGDHGLFLLREEYLFCHDLVTNILVPDFNHFWAKNQEDALKRF